MPDTKTPAKPDTIAIEFTIAELNRVIGALGDRAHKMTGFGAVQAAEEYEKIRRRMLDEGVAALDAMEKIDAKWFIGLIPVLGHAGWGCADPDRRGGDFLSDGHETRDAAVAAAATARAERAARAAEIRVGDDVSFVEGAEIETDEGDGVWTKTTIGPEWAAGGDEQVVVRVVSIDDADGDNVEMFCDASGIRVLAPVSTLVRA